MKVTGTLTLLCCLLLLLPAEGQRRHYRGRSNRGRNPGRALRRLATAGLLFGAGTAVGVALARGKRDVSFDDADLGLAEETVLEAVQAADSDRCMEQWLCDITARPEQQRADEEQDMVLLFEDEAAAGISEQPGSFHAVYVAAAARGLRAAAEGDRSSCQLPSCRLQPDQLLQQLRDAEEGDER